MRGAQSPSKRGKRRFNKLASLQGHFELVSKQGLGCSCSETQDDARFDYRDLRLQPGLTGTYLYGVGLFVDPAFSARLEFEMFHHISDIS
jgi:hypothetical protein